MHWTNGAQFLAGAMIWDFYLCHCDQTGSGVHLVSCPVGTEGSYPGGKQPGCKADHLPPSSAEVKKVWSYTSTSPVHIHGMVLN
jgi:hypothetical protein